MPITCDCGEHLERCHECGELVCWGCEGDIHVLEHDDDFDDRPGEAWARERTTDTIGARRRD